MEVKASTEKTKLEQTERALLALVDDMLELLKVTERVRVQVFALQKQYGLVVV